MKSRATPFVAALLSSAAIAVAQAPPTPLVEPPPLPPQYEVEILVFANRDFDPSEERFDQGFGTFADGPAELREVPVFDDSNFGPLAPGVSATPPTDALAAPDASMLRARPLLPTELKLGNEYRKLQAISAYLPLLHAGWVQPGLPEADAEPFNLKLLGALNPRGTVRVHLSRFLHITLDLTYQATSASTTAASTSDDLSELAFAPRYRLTATRNARSGELHYFDHPAFGVLVRVTPLRVQGENVTGRPAA